MPFPSLESLSPMLDRLTMDALGDTIQYRPANDVWRPVKAEVDYRDAVKAFEQTQVIEQDITVKLLKVDVPAKPDANVRLQFPLLPELTFRPLNPRSTDGGTEWEFEVTRAKHD